MASEAVERELAWRASEVSCEFFLEQFVHIQVPGGPPQLIKLYDSQREALGAFLCERYNLVLKARQIGWTTLVSGLILWEAMFKSDQNIIVLSRTKEDAAALLGKTSLMYELLPLWMRERGPKRLNNNKHDLIFDNRSRITSLASKSNPARGRTATRIVADEWAFFENPEEAWASIEPAVDVGGSFIGLSTANGSGNFFHDMWTRATTGVDTRFNTMFFGWASNGRSQAWYDQKAAATEEWQMAQEYPKNPDEAFIRSGRPFFNPDMLMALRRETPMCFAELHGDLGRWFYREVSAGPLRMWEAPDPKGAYAIGADVAGGMSGDYSVAIVVNARTGRVCAKWRGRIDPDRFGEVLYQLGHFYNRAIVGPELNNHGYAVIGKLLALSYPNLYRRHTGFDAHVPSQMETYGWKTLKNTKALALDALQAAIREGELHPLCPEIIAELGSFRVEENGDLEGHPFDDQVMALAITNQMAKLVFTREYQKEVVPHGSIAWWKQQWKHETAAPQRLRIGLGRKFR